MATNKKDYLRNYYHKEKNKLIKELGGSCSKCGRKKNIEIHHKIEIGFRRPSGMLNRLTEWKRNKWNLQLLCRNCHTLHHQKREQT